MSRSASFHSRAVIISGFALILTLLAGVTYTALSRLDEINRRLQTIVHVNNAKTELAHEMRSVFQRRLLTLYAMYLTDDEFERQALHDKFRLLASRFLSAREQLRGFTLSQEEQLHLEHMARKSSLQAVGRNEVADLLADNHFGEGLEALTERVLPSYDSILEGFAELVAIQRRNTEYAQREAAAAYLAAYVLVGSSGLVALLVGMLVSIRVFRHASSHEATLRHAMALAEADAHSKGESLDRMNLELQDRNQALSDLNRELERSIEQLSQANDTAESASRSKGEFLANMSHEIRTPLNAVLGMTQLLLDTSLNTAQRDYAETIFSSGNALLGIINDILDFSKIEAGKLDLETLPFDVIACVESAMDLIAGRCAENGVELMLRHDDGLPPQVAGDITRLRQILANLLGNAAKFTHQGDISVCAAMWSRTETHCELVFSVRDSGIGIPADRLSYLFDSFSQVDASTSRKFGGTGLGLAISKHLCGLMGGKLWVESLPDAGATFFFTIRARLYSAELPAYRQTHAPSGKRALVVDDNATLAVWLKTLLERWGYGCEIATTQAAGVAALRQRTFSVVLVDMEIPGGGGLVFSRLARDHDIHTPLILLVSLGAMAWKEAENEGLYTAHVHKPIKSRQLFETLDSLSSLASPKPEPPPEAAPPEPSNLRILLAEDNVVNQKVALLMLKRLGYQADVANNGLEVLEALERKPFDVVLMDVQMPEMDGIQATLEVRERMGDTPYIIAMTAHALHTFRERCMNAGMNDFITKPVKSNELSAALARFPGTQ